MVVVLKSRGEQLRLGTVRGQPGEVTGEDKSSAAAEAPGLKGSLREVVAWHHAAWLESL